MDSATEQPRSLAAKASWVSCGLALGGVCLLVLFLIVDQASAFQRTGQGVLTGFLPRAFLSALWGGEGLAAVAGLASFALIRREDIKSKAVIGIGVRSLCGIVVGIGGGLVLWMIVGHTVIGF